MHSPPLVCLLSMDFPNPPRPTIFSMFSFFMAMSGQGGTSKNPVSISRQPRGARQERIHSLLICFNSYSSELCGRNTQQTFCLLGTQTKSAFRVTRESSDKYFSPSLTCHSAAKFQDRSNEPSAKDNSEESGA